MSDNFPHRIAFVRVGKCSRDRFCIRHQSSTVGHAPRSRKRQPRKSRVHVGTAHDSRAAHGWRWAFMTMAVILHARGAMLALRSRGFNMPADRESLGRNDGCRFAISDPHKSLYCCHKEQIVHIGSFKPQVYRSAHSLCLVAGIIAGSMDSSLRFGPQYFGFRACNLHRFCTVGRGTGRAELVSFGSQTGQPVPTNKGQKPASPLNRQTTTSTLRLTRSVGAYFLDESSFV